MSTLIISDLHLGSRLGSDVLRRPGPRAALLEALEDVDRLVLLGDVLELRHGPPRYAMAAARPFFEDLGRVLAGREIVVSAGNHDHLLVESWLGERALRAPGAARRSSSACSRSRPRRCSRSSPSGPRPARVSVAYPGLWVRPDVYATHGHYLDCHLTVPTIERLSVGAMSRVLGRPAASFGRVEDYEAVARRCSRGGTRWPGKRAPAARSIGSTRSAPGVRSRGAGRSGGSAVGRSGAPLRRRSQAARAARSPAPSRSPSPRSIVPGWARCAPTSPPMSCAAPGCARWARWPTASASATPTWSSVTPTAPGRSRATTSPSGAGAAARAW